MKKRLSLWRTAALLFALSMATTSIAASRAKYVDYVADATTFYITRINDPLLRSGIVADRSAGVAYTGRYSTWTLKKGYWAFCLRGGRGVRYNATRTPYNGAGGNSGTADGIVYISADNTPVYAIAASGGDLNAYTATTNTGDMLNSALYGGGQGKGRTGTGSTGGGRGGGCSILYMGNVNPAAATLIAVAGGGGGGGAADGSDAGFAGGAAGNVGSLGTVKPNGTLAVGNGADGAADGTAQTHGKGGTTAGGAGGSQDTGHLGTNGGYLIGGHGHGPHTGTNNRGGCGGGGAGYFGGGGGGCWSNALYRTGGGGGGSSMTGANTYTLPTATTSAYYYAYNYFNTTVGMYNITGSHDGAVAMIYLGMDYTGADLY